MFLRTTRLALLFSALATLLSACAEPECPVGTIKIRNICRHIDAGTSLDDAAVVAADGAQQDDESDAGDGHDGMERDASTAGTDAGAVVTTDASGTAGLDAGGVSQTDSGIADASTTGAVDATADAVVNCAAGYVLKNGACQDIDECFEGAHACHMTSTCKNAAGSYDCTCALGYSGGTNAGFACAPRIAVGNGFACALQSDGRVKCWGANSHGELGDGTVLSHSTPAFVKGLDHVVAIAAHDSTSACALRDDGRVTCWGDNVSGQLGDGTTDSHSEPKLLPTLTSAVSISVRNTRACVVVRDGGLRCWGSVGSLGSGGVGTSLTPTPTTGIPPMASVEVGWGGSGCAVTRVGTVWCWGNNLTDVAAQVPGIANAIQVSLGVGFSCVLRGDSRPQCWGSDPAAATVAAIDLAGLSLGLEGSYTVQRNGVASMWRAMPRDSTDYLLGSAAIDGVAVAGGGAGSPSACAVVRDGTLRCWGINVNGQLGDGTTTSTSVDSGVLKVTTVSGLDLW